MICGKCLHSHEQHIFVNNIMNCSCGSFCDKIDFDTIHEATPYAGIAKVKRQSMKQ